MAFWTKERLEQEQSSRPLINIPDYDSDRIEQCAYALGVAAEYAITLGTDGGKKHVASIGEHITIPPGQFALLLTEEKILVPPDAIAFISMKAKYKLRGLINVSGFHVDPGFSGRLKFAVYNAGGTAIDLKPGQRLFLIWYCDLDQTTSAVYDGSHQGQDGITPEDVASIRGIVASPAGISSRISSLDETLRAEVRRLESKIETHQNWSRPILTAIAVALVLFFMNTFFGPASDRRAEQRTAVGPSAALPSNDPVQQLPATQPE